MCLLEGTRFSQDRLISGAAPVFNYGGMAFFLNFKATVRLLAGCARCWRVTAFPHAIIFGWPPGRGQVHSGADAGPDHELPGDRGTGRGFSKRMVFPTTADDVENCRRIGQAEDLDARFAEAVEAREGLRETDKKETRILVQTPP